MVDRMPLRLLLIDDSPDDALLVVLELNQGGYDVTSERVDTAAALSEALERGGWDAITCDWVMPRFSAPAALELIRERHCEVPVIVVSGQVGEEVAATAMRAGAHDYVSKSKLARLVPAFERELRETEVRRARKRAEEALQRSEWKYRTLVESSHDVIWAVDTAGRVLFCNRCVRDVLGYEPEELVGHALTDFVHEDEAARRMEGLRAGRPVHDAEVEAQRKDGTRVVLSVMGDVLRDETGKVIGATGTARDVGEQKRAARELQREKAFSDAVIASVPGTFYVVDRQGRFVRWNRAQEELTGLGAEQLAGLEALATIHEDDRPHVAAKLEEVFERGHAELEARLLAASGEVRHFHFTGKRMDVDGAAYLVGTGIDVTERKRRRGGTAGERGSLSRPGREQRRPALHPRPGRKHPVGEPRSGAHSATTRARCCG